jgi:hypothetical protein
MRVNASLLTREFLRRLLLGAVLAVLIVAFSAAASNAATITFGSPLSVPASLNTAESLTYQGMNTAVPPSPQAPSGNVHTFHFGADGAFWNADQADGSAAAPTAGQAIKLSVEGCAQPAAGGPPPLTQIHFQSISPLPNGGAKVNLSSQGFDLPVCGSGGASGSTVSSYEPVNLCVNAGDHIDLNEEGGFVEHSYQSGVPYRVLGAVAGSTADSFIRGGGTGNGAALSASDTTAMDGFAANHGEELMMRVELGTGADATPACGGRKGVPPPLAPIRVSPQTDGVSHAHLVSVEVFCRVSPECKGVATLSLHGTTYGHRTFSMPPHKTLPLPIHVSSPLVKLLSKHRGKVHALPMTLSLTVAGQTVTQQIGLEIPF